LGVSTKLAIYIGLSSKGYYRLAKTKVVQMSLNNDCLKAQGLVPVKEKWVKFIIQMANEPLRGSACRVVWGEPERNRLLPDYKNLVEHGVFLPTLSTI